MADTRTGRAREKWAAELRAELEEIGEHLSRGLELMRHLEAETKGVNGIPNLLRNKGTEIATTIGLLEEEAEKVASRIPSLPFVPDAPEVEEVRQDHMEAVMAAKEGE